MTDAQQRAAAKQFAADWKNRGYEKGESQPFWLSLLQKVYGIEEPEKYITFEDQVHLDHTSFIDGSIPTTHVLIEQKGLGKDLNKPIRQSDGSLLTPFQQAKRYAAELPYSMRPRWIVTCNFAEFHIYDMEQPSGEAEVVLLENLGTEYYRLQFLVDTGDSHIQKEMEISLQAGDLVGAIYDAVLKQYKNPDDPETLRSLNKLCVRLVFCLYAEDAGIFGGHGKFHHYLKGVADKDVRDVRRALIDLFKVLDTKPEDRDPYMDEELASFPYVNGGLFADENIIIPRLDANIVDLILQKASEEFDWSAISPTIFGAVFESTLNPETRRSGGMHYTSIENIHKVIDPLFLDDLKEELAAIKEITVDRTKDKKLRDFQKKLSQLIFFDPACGSGNFLTETYISLRRIENEVLNILQRGQIIFGTEGWNPIQVSISQFYGIEINDFAVTVAKTALWIAESQMMKETEDVVHMSLDFLPLKTYANITEGNALRVDWEKVVPKFRLSYIMGNPPFIGYTYQSPQQKEDLSAVTFGTGKSIDYVSGWYFKAAKLMENTNIRTAFVSTNSITQGEQVAGVWKPLYDKYNLHIDFAHRTFQWDSEASLKAHVHCVIVGFSIATKSGKKRLFTSDRFQEVNNISPYLLDAPTIFIERRTKPLCDVPSINKGSQPTDGGNLIIAGTEYESFLASCPDAKPYVKLFLGSDEFINGKKRYCLWLAGINPAELIKMPQVLERIKKVKEFRLSSKKAATRKQAETPALFTENRQPETNYIVIPEVSSQSRRYVPMGFLSPDVVCSNKLQLIPNASLYHFGILTSNVHMAWMRAVCGRLKSDYDYSGNIVYNNFPWPTPTEAQKRRIEETAQAILSARGLYPDSSLAALYNELIMPRELRKAHQDNDRAVMQAYGFDVKSMTESSCVAALMKMYQEILSKK